MKKFSQLVVSILLISLLSGCSYVALMASEMHDQHKGDRLIPQMQQQGEQLHQKTQRNQLTPAEKLTYAHYVKNQAVNTFLPTDQRTNEQALHQIYNRYLTEAKDAGYSPAVNEYIDNVLLSAFERESLQTQWSLKEMTLTNPQNFAEGLRLAKIEASKSCAVFPLVKRHSFNYYTEDAWTVYPLKNFLQNPEAVNYPQLRQDVEYLVNYQTQHCPQTLNIHSNE